MMKKMTLLVAAIAAIAAFAVPAAAQASEPVITNNEEEPAQHITADGIGVKWTTSVGLLNCTTVTTTIGLISNTNNTATGAGTGTAAGNPLIPTDTGECVTEPSGLQFNTTSITISSFDLGAGKGDTTFSYTWDITHPILGNIMCNFTGTAGLSYEATSDKIKLENGALVGTQNIPPCPEKGSMAGEFTITDEFGSPAVLH
jgi:hypothetical protein